ncbi:lipopolysaccharide biosynthesis protein [Eubacterium sp.]|uniref:lipopolysaccharide biosynthesis protein n=1 Tax=Eubacterium sp. TaxID=142586 RepID=UPI003990FDE4
MNNAGRLKNSFINFMSGIGNRLLTMLLSFVVRTVFVKCLNTEYLGVNGLYSNILNMLSLADLGFGTAMVFSMYRPLAENDKEKLNQLMALYKKVYAIIGTVILILGLGLVPFLDYLIKNPPNINGLTFYYILFLFNSVVSYWFFAYKTALLQADQKVYITTNYSSVFSVIKSILQIVVLVIFHNFTFYLITQILCTICQNIAVAIKVNKMYPFFKEKCKSDLPKHEKGKIFGDVKALMLTQIAHITLNSTDNIIISAFVGIKEVGLLSNFVMISDAITALLCQITSSVSASLGNFFVKESVDSRYALFKKIEFLNFWLYSFSMVALITLLNPFIDIWLGEGYLIEQSAVVCLGINFFVAGFMNTIGTFRTTLGLFTQGKYRPIIVSVINIGLSILLSYKWGMTGVLAATFISRLCVNLWYDPLLIHRDGFNKPVKPYYFKLLFRFSLLACVVVVMQLISSTVFVGGVTIIKFIIMVIITAILPNVVFALVFNKIEEFKYFKTLFFKNILKKVILAIKSCKIKN